MKSKPEPKSKPMTCVACDFNLAALQDASDQYNEAKSIAQKFEQMWNEAENQTAIWKRIWSQDSRLWFERMKQQADLIAALIEGSKALRRELDRHEKFHVFSPSLADCHKLEADMYKDKRR